MWRVPFLLGRLRVETRAATAVEYGLILAGIVLVIFGALQALGGSTANMWNNISTKVLAAH
ncbi:Flp family type IVb pilin [Sphingomonas bacterium]|uniref:Flp family type IVb pilin n=1 Tax=Sphingomonas bacterium TaxID=1895847 RepID=UPI001575E1E4|nr:Flp family type IVb pilin [Sphingomonas bacterium]